MFEILCNVDREVATEAVYHAGLRIYEREFYPDWREWLHLRPGNPRNATSLDVAAQLIDEIEYRSGRPLAELSDAELRHFDRVIEERMSARYGPSTPATRERADQILAEMRRDYGSPARDAAA
jgi:hypothetical protein